METVSPDKNSQFELQVTVHRDKCSGDRAS